MTTVPIKPLEVFAMDKDRVRASSSINYESLFWTRRYYECGQFEITVRSDEYDPSWAYIYSDDRPETGIIQKVEYSDTTQGAGPDTVTLSGFFMERIAWDRIIPCKNPDGRSSDKAIDVADRCSSVAAAVFGDSLKVLPPACELEAQCFEPDVGQLDEFLYGKLQPCGASFRVVYDYETDQLTFQVWQGVDRTQDQTEMPWATFSDTWGKLYGFDYMEDTSNAKNVCYVFYSYDEPRGYDQVITDSRTTTNNPPVGAPSIRENWRVYGSYYEGELVHIIRPVGWIIPYDHREGFIKVTRENGCEASETFIDRRDDAPDCDTKWSREEYVTKDTSKFPDLTVPPLPDGYPENFAGVKQSIAAFKADLENVGRELLDNSYQIISNLNTGTVDTSKYMIEWDLGDLVDEVMKQIGVSQTARIIGVTEGYAAGEAQIDIEMGEPIVTVMRKAGMAWH